MSILPGAYTTNAAPTPRVRSLAERTLVIAAGAACVVCAAIAPGTVSSAASQAWPPFALVAGLLLVGGVAADDGVFAAAGSRLAALPLGPAPLLAALLGLVAAVTATLNLDTAVVFLTPLLLHTARSRGLDERPYLYGVVLMSNSASLLLPGSNLTNLMVLAGRRMPGAVFAASMLGPWLIAIAATWLVLWLVYRHDLGRGRRPAHHARVPMRGRLGAVAAALAAALVLAVPDPSLTVLALGMGVVAWRRRGRGNPPPRSVLGAGAWRLAGLFALVVIVGSAARWWRVPAELMHGGGAWQSTVAGAVTAAVLNNLPAAALLGAHAPAHPLALLLGLDLGPNLVVTGALSAVLWLHVAQRNHARTSVLTYSKLGCAIVALSLLPAMACLTAVSRP